MMSHASTQPQGSSMETTSPHTSQWNWSPRAAFTRFAFAVLDGALTAAFSAGFSAAFGAAFAAGFAVAFLAFGSTGVSAFALAVFAGAFFAFGAALAIFLSPPPYLFPVHPARFA
jgi:hypothetical protein